MARMEAAEFQATLADIRAQQRLREQQVRPLDLMVDLGFVEAGYTYRFMDGKHQGCLPHHSSRMSTV